MTLSCVILADFDMLFGNTISSISGNEAVGVKELGS